MKTVYPPSDVDLGEDVVMPAYEVISFDEAGKIVSQISYDKDGKEINAILYGYDAFESFPRSLEEKTARNR